MTPSSGKQTQGIRFLRLENADAVGKKAAELVADQLRQKPDSVLIFPTGKTPLSMYGHLRARRDISWSQSRLFQLDEYVNPGKTEPVYETFARFLDEHLWGHIDGRKFYIRDYDHDAAAYEKALQTAGPTGPDMVILGIGGNGHIAFNEPGSAPDSATRNIHLADETLRNNFGHNAHQPGYPTEAITLGLKTILSAKKVILLATGANKREIVKRAFDPDTPPTADLPASWLKTHPDVTVMTDFDV